MSTDSKAVSLAATLLVISDLSKRLPDDVLHEALVFQTLFLFTEETFVIFKCVQVFSKEFLRHIQMRDCLSVSLSSRL